jgi:hypothetical protein
MDVELPLGMPFPRVTGVEVVPPYGLHLTFMRSPTASRFLA